MLFLRIIALISLFAVACGEQPDRMGDPSDVRLSWGPGSNVLFEAGQDTTGIEGDWFACDDDLCTRYERQGLRFGPDGVVTWLSFDFGNRYQYCERFQAGYTYDGTTVSYFEDRGRGRQLVGGFEMVINGNDAVVSRGQLDGIDFGPSFFGRDYTHVRRMVPTNSFGICPRRNDL